jgi:glycosyltransferase involved in cell wall biosynthesis
MIVGGAQLNTLYTCRLLDRRRFRATLLTGSELGSEGDLLSTARDEVPTVVIPSLVRDIRPRKDLAAYRSIATHLRAGAYSVVHTHTSKAGILARYAAHRRGIPVIVHTAHGWQWTHARSRGMNRLIIEAERCAARFSDRIIVVSERDREKGLEAGVGRPEQYVLIESAIPLDTFDPAKVDGAAFRAEFRIPLDAPVVGTVGRFAYQKAPEVMLEAAMKLLSRSPCSHFVYVGDGPLRERLLNNLGRVDARKRLHLAGIRRDVSAALAAMDVFALSSRYEGLPRVAVEAMAMGKPVVTTPADGIVDVVEDNLTGNLVPFEDSEALAQAMVSLINAPARARAMGAEARKRVLPRFDVNEMVRRIEATYVQLLGEKGIA